MNDTESQSNIYAAPTSGFEEQSKDDRIMMQLKRQQSITAGIVIAIVSSIGVLEVLSRVVGIVPMYAFLIPGFVVGILVKVLARPFSMIARLIPSLIVAVVVCVNFSVFGFSIFSILLPILNILVCLGLSRRLMNYEQEAVLFRRRVGK